MGNAPSGARGAPAAVLPVPPPSSIRSADAGLAAEAASAPPSGGALGGPPGSPPPAAPPPPPGSPSESAVGLWVLPESERGRQLRDVYDVPDGEMGRGHYGVVRQGTRRADGVSVAVKSIAKRRAVYVEMLRNEIAVLRLLQGRPYVIDLYDTFEDESTVHIVFELCGGGELFEPIANPGIHFSEHQASRLVRRVLQAVQACHEQNICHRDLKPENMLLKEPGIDSELKIIDFGLATHVAPGERLSRHVGTPYYIAPEVLGKQYTLPCDMWSVGVIAFTLLCGYPPFWGDTEREIYLRIKRGKYQFEGPDWAQRTAHSKDFIRRLLVMDPAQRSTVAVALAHPWIAFEGEVPEPGSRRFVARLRLYSRQHWLKRLATVLAAVDALATNEPLVTWVRGLFEAYCPAAMVVVAAEAGWAAAAAAAAPEAVGSAAVAPQPQPAADAAAAAPPPLSPAALRFSFSGDVAASPEVAAAPAGWCTPPWRSRRRAGPAAASCHYRMTLPDLRAALRRRGLHFTDRECDGMFAGLDVNSDGVVGLPEFAAAALPRMAALGDEAVTSAFTALDHDGDGRLGISDLLFAAGGSMAVASAALVSAGGPADGYLSMADFIRVVCSGESSVL